MLVTFNELLTKLNVRKQSLNRVLRVLIKENLITQKLNNEDARKKNLFLSDSASKTLNEAIKPIIYLLSRAYVKSGAGSVQGFNQVIDSFIGNNS